MRLTELLRSEAVRRRLIDPGTEIDLAQAFYLVRDMPYRRASDRMPETIIAEWCGTCSGKHYLLRQVFAELGWTAHVVACTTIVPVGAEQVTDTLKDLYQAANRRFVDVHNYLVLELPGGQEMVVDATWPLSAREFGMPSNRSFVLGQDQEIAADPIATVLVPKDTDPQAFKDELLRSHFSEAELDFREEVIRALSERSG